MKNETLILIAGIITITLLVIARFFFTGTDTKVVAPAPTPAPIMAAPDPTPPPTPLPSYPEDPSPVRPRPTGTVCDTKNFICVGAQLVNATLANPLSATGTAIAFENTLQWKLKNASGTQIALGTLTAAAPDIGQPGPFTLNQMLSPTPIGPHTLTFYESSAENGNPIHVLVIPVSF